ncbi:MAG: GxxExxY protein [Chlamydiales bacterium]|nr:GxxExxY protein [Chlamydiales bacterium]
MEPVLCHESSLRNSQKQLATPVVYKTTSVTELMFLDIPLEEKPIIEVKATRKDYPIYHAELPTYIRLTAVNLGLLINFG